MDNSKHYIQGSEVLERIAELQPPFEEQFNIARRPKASTSVRTKALKALAELLDIEYDADFREWVLTTETKLEEVLQDCYSDNAVELCDLLSFRDDAISAVGEQHFKDRTFIHEDAFEEYAQSCAEDICGIKDINHWPFNHLDWEAAAAELTSDYFAVAYGDVTYYCHQ